MVDAVSGSAQGMQGMMKMPSPDEMFAKMSKEAGGDGTSISKDQLQSLLDKAKENGADTKGLEDLLSKFDDISTGKDADGNSVITSDDIKSATKNGTIQPPPPPPGAQGAGEWQTSFSKDDVTPPVDLQV